VGVVLRASVRHTDAQRAAPCDDGVYAPSDCHQTIAAPTRGAARTASMARAPSPKEFEASIDFRRGRRWSPRGGCKSNVPFLYRRLVDGAETISFAYWSIETQ